MIAIRHLHATLRSSSPRIQRKSGRIFLLARLIVQKNRLAVVVLIESGRYCFALIVFYRDQRHINVKALSYRFQVNYFKLFVLS